MVTDGEVPKNGTFMKLHTLIFFSLFIELSKKLSVIVCFYFKVDRLSFVILKKVLRWEHLRYILFPEIFGFLMKKTSLGVKFDSKLFKIAAVLCITEYIIRKRTL